MKRIRAEFKQETPLNEEQSKVVVDMLNSMAFRVFEIYLRNKFNREYKKLRNTRRRDESYERINGFLDGIEFVVKCKDSFHCATTRKDGEGEENGN